MGLPNATDDNVNITKEAVKEAISIHHLRYLKTEINGKMFEAMARTDMRNIRDYLYPV